LGYWIQRWLFPMNPKTLPENMSFENGEL